MTSVVEWKIVADDKPAVGKACLALIQGKTICLDVVRIDTKSKWWCYFAGNRHPEDPTECRQDFTHWCYLDELQVTLNMEWSTL